MPQRAAWQTHGEDPGTAFGWFVADASTRPLSPWFAMVLALALVSLAHTLSAWILLTLPALALSVRVPRRPSDLTPLRTTPPPGPAFACRIGTSIDSVLSHFAPGTLVGIDEGVVTFVDGWLHYAGHRTEFSLRPSDVWDTSLVASRWTLWLADDTSLTLEPLDDRDDDFLGRAFRLWKNDTPEPAGTPILPPGHVHPSGLARAWWQALVTVAVVLLMAGILIAFNAIFMLFLFAGGGWTNFSRLAKLHRLARQERPARLEGTRSV